MRKSLKSVGVIEKNYKYFSSIYMFLFRYVKNF